MTESTRNGLRLPRRGVIAGAAGMTVGAGLAMAGTATPAAAAAAPARSSRADGSFSTLSVGVGLAEWGSIFLSPGQSQTWWFTWAFDGHRWSRMSAVPLAESPAGSSVEIVSEWANPGTLNVTFRNNSAVGVIFRPTAIVAPG